MYLLLKFDGYRSYGNEDINFYINSYINACEKAELTASIHYIERFSKSGIPVSSSEVPDKAGKKKQEINGELNACVLDLQVA